jgi:Uncharacterized conserved protein (DUF2293)
MAGDNQAQKTWAAFFSKDVSWKGVSTAQRRGRVFHDITHYVYPSFFEVAVNAWMRHQTTAYDGMVISRVRMKGKRREIWRMLARRSHELLAG